MSSNNGKKMENLNNKNMKKYKVIVLHSGMNYRTWKVYANRFEVKEGVYFFYQDDILLNTFPVALTVIDEIGDVDEE